MSNRFLKRKGFTLIELLIAMMVGGIVVAGAAAAMNELFKVSNSASDDMAAFTHVQNAGFWISHDTVMAQQVDTGDDVGTPDVIEFLELEWVDWENDVHRAVYTLEGTGELKQLVRTYSFQVDGVDQPDQTIIIARYIDPGESACSWDGTVLTLEITSKVGASTATRTYHVKTRPLS